MKEPKVIAGENEDTAWYQDLESPDGIHVMVVTGDVPDGKAIVYGRLDKFGGIQIDDYYMQVLDYTTTLRHWTRHTMIYSITYIWDEQTYEKIPASKIKVGDYIDTGSALCPIVGTVQGKETRIKYEVAGTTKVVNYNGYALRKRTDPTTPGLYKNKNGDYCILNPKDNQWYTCSFALSKDKPEPEYAPYRLMAVFKTE